MKIIMKTDCLLTIYLFISSFYPGNNCYTVPFERKLTITICNCPNNVFSNFISMIVFDIHNALCIICYYSHLAEETVI